MPFRFDRKLKITKKEIFVDECRGYYCRLLNVALITASATLNELPDRAKRPKHSTNKAFDKSGVYSNSPKVADAMIELMFKGVRQRSDNFLHRPQNASYPG